MEDAARPVDAAKSCYNRQMSQPDSITRAAGVSGGSDNPTTIDADVLDRRASSLYQQGHFDAAAQLAMDILEADKNRIESLLTLASALRELGRFDDALKVLRRIAQLDPKHRGAHAAYALTLFYKEDWPRAWRAFDVRFRLMDKPPEVNSRGADGKPVAMKPWRGGALPPTLLVMGEQGLGDTIQFARFLPMLTAAGVKVTCVVQQRLFKLIGTLDAAIDLRPLETPGTVKGVKAWTPMMHLPQALNLDPSQFAPRVPYLRAEPVRVARWKERIGTHGFKIGIVWQGNPDSRIDQGRSAPLAAYAPLAEIPGARLISLQHGEAAKQIAAVPFGDRVESLGDDFDSGPDGFLDTAAVMEVLDLIVTVDTSVGHVAGALGRPVFILLKAVGADWRWLYRRDDTAWYPTARLFRQGKPGDWEELLARVADAVRGRAGVAPATPMTPVSVGELLDKLVILQIKSERIENQQQRANVITERDALAAVAELYLGREGVGALMADLKAVNEALWDLEDKIRDCERRKSFEADFREFARAIYVTNDRRAGVKKQINALCGSALVEEKAYKAY
jgi:tetratricopeptide (TPR) repeat protein